jgi:signal transduction histidine kinase
MSSRVGTLRAKAGPREKHGLPTILDGFVAVSESLDLPTTLNRIVRAAADVVDAEYGALGVLDGRGGLAEFVYVGIDDTVRARIGRLPTGHGLIGLLIDHPQVLRLTDLTAHPASVGFPPGHPPMHSFVGVPVRIGAEVFGNLYLTEKRGGRQFTRRDELVLQAMASAAGAAVQRTRLFDEIQRRERWLVAAAEIRSKLLSGEPLVDMLAEVVRRSRELTNADSALLLVPDGWGMLRIAASSGDGMQALAGCTVDPNEDFTRAIRAGAALYGRDELPLPKDRAFARILARSGSVLATRLPAAATADGVLICRRTPRSVPFATSDVALLDGLAELASLAFEVAHRADEHRRLALLTERERIARDLHDHVIQRLFAVGLGLQGQESRASDPLLHDRLDTAVTQIDEAIRDLRSSIFDLRANAGDRRNGLRGRLLDIAANVGDGQPAVTMRIEGAVDTLVPPLLAQQAEAVVREALSNAVRHSGCSSVSISVSASKELTINVTDNGRGFTAAARRSGLRNLAERAEADGGSFAIQPGSAGGTNVHWSVPLPPE